MRDPAPFHARICSSSRLWEDCSALEIAQSMMRLRLTHLELACDPAAKTRYRPGEDNSRLLNTLAEAGVHVVALRLTGLEYREKIVTIQEAGELGIPLIVDRAEMLGYPDLIERTWTYAYCAARSGVELALDNDFYSCVDNAEAQAELRRSVTHRALGFAFAPIYAFADGRNPAEEVHRLGPWLRMAYLWDAPATMHAAPLAEHFQPGPMEHQAPGGLEGRLDWLEYFAALRAVNFRGIFNLRWIGSESWPIERVESTIRDALIFCGERAREAGFD